MKKLILILLLAVIIFYGCQTDAKVVDLAEIEMQVSQQADNYLKFWNAKDIEALEKMLTEDGMYLGSDPGEILRKNDLIEMWKMIFPDTTMDISYTVDLRKIKPAKNGESAMVVEHIIIKDWSHKLAVRQTSYYIFVENSWKIDYMGWGLLAKNEDIEKLNKALE